MFANVEWASARVDPSAILELPGTSKAFKDKNMNEDTGILKLLDVLSDTIGARFGIVGTRIFLGGPNV